MVGNVADIDNNQSMGLVKLSCVRNVWVRKEPVYDLNAGAVAYAYKVDPAGCYAVYAEVARHAPIATAAEGPSTISITVEGRFEE